MNASFVFVFSLAHTCKMLFFIMFPLLNGFIFRLQMNYDDALPLNKNFLH